MMMKMTFDPTSSLRPHWTKHLREIRAQLAGFPEVLVASDFDGTLSPIVEHPADARLEPTTSSVLQKLADLHPRVRLAFLSGRSLEDLTPRLGKAAEGAILAGNHGLEISGCGLDWIRPVLNASRSELDSLIVQLHRFFASIPGLEIEDKGASITLHYRRMQQSFLPALLSMIRSLELPAGIRVHEGKKVFEFRPRVEWNKGFAIRKIANHLEIPDAAIVFLGDDLTDEDAFQELSGDAVTVHVGSLFENSSARFNAEDPQDVVSLLGETFTSGYFG